MSVSYGAETRVTLAAGAQLEYTKRLPTVSLGRKVIMVGPVPVEFNPTFDLAATLSGEVKGGVTVGLKYSREVGARIVKDGDGTRAEQIDKPGEDNGGSISFTAEATVRGELMAEFTLIIYEAGGPGIGVGPYVEWKADPLGNPWWEERVGIKVDAYVRASKFLGGGEWRLEGLIDKSWKVRDSGGGFTGVSIDPAKATVEVGKTADFRMRFHGVDPSAVTWKVTAGPGSIDATGRYTAGKAGVAEITGSAGGRTAKALVLAQCWLSADPPALGKLSAPRDVRATAGSASATVTWAPPAVTGGLPVRSYAIVTTPHSRTTYVGANQRAATIKGLKAGDKYQVLVYAITDVAVSPASAASPAITPTG